ncbi:MAG TPA: hypothetical protein VE912_09170 [Bacteroidales bacterium]|nr:hypothetical protein [Bacteroidales bacterium]
MKSHQLQSVETIYMLSDVIKYFNLMRRRDGHLWRLMTHLMIITGILSG